LLYDRRYWRYLRFRQQGERGLEIDHVTATLPLKLHVSRLRYLSRMRVDLPEALQTAGKRVKLVWGHLGLSTQPSSDDSDLLKCIRGSSFSF
jgi:hypothetical protein